MAVQEASVGAGASAVPEAPGELTRPGPAGDSPGRAAGAAFPLVSAWLILALVAALLAFVVYMTFVPGLPTDGGWTLKNWRNLGSQNFLTRVLPNTLILGFGSITVAGFFGLPLAWLLNRVRLPFQHTFRTFMALILVVPGYVAAMGWIMLVDEHIGLLNAALSAVLRVESIPLTVTNNVLGMTWVMGIVIVPAFFFLVAGPIRAIDPSLEEAARMSGAGGFQCFRKIDVPLLMPGILGALIYTFITAVSIFEIPALLGAAGGRVPVIATEVFYAVRPAGPQTSTFAYGAAGVYGLALAIPSLVALYFYLRLLDRSERYQVVTGKGYQLRDTELGRFTVLGVLFVLLYLALALFLPLLVLLWASLLPVLQMPSAQVLSRLTASNYQSLLVTLGSAGIVSNTVLLVLVVSLLTVFFSMMISWVVVRTRLRQRKLLDMLSIAPHAIPGLAFAFAIAMLGILASRWAAWLPFAGTMVVIVIADLVNRLPYGTRMGNAALVQVHPALEEAAQTSGAGHLTVLWRILLPTIRPTIIYALVWTGLLTLQEVSMALFLAGPSNRVLSVAIFQLWQSGNTGQAAAGTIVLAVVLGVVTSLILRATRIAVGGDQAPYRQGA